MSTELGTREGSELGPSEDSERGGELIYLPVFPRTIFCLGFHKWQLSSSVCEATVFREGNYDCHENLEGDEGLPWQSNG